MAGVDTSYRDTLGNPYYTGGTKKDDKSEGVNFDAVFVDEKEQQVSVDDFLTLMVAQLKNQDFMNPVDDTQYVTQLAQFATMQQMQELAEYSRSSYVMGMIGKDVTVAKFNVSGTVDKQTGPVEKVSLVDGEYTIYVGGKPYTMEQVMEVHNPNVTPQDEKIDTANLSVVPTKVTAHTAEVSWETPTESESMAGRLTYTVYYSYNAPFDTVESVEKGYVVGEKDRKGLTNETLTGLYEDTTYYVNVVVTDPSGNKYVYNQAAFQTRKEGSEND